MFNLTNLYFSKYQLPGLLPSAHFLIAPFRATVWVITAIKNYVTSEDQPLTPKGLDSRDQAMARGLMNILKGQRDDEGLLYQFRSWSRWSIDRGSLLKGKESSRVAGKLTPSTEWGNRRRRLALLKIKNRNIFVTFVTCRRLLQMHSIDAHVNFRIPFPFLGAWKNELLLF